MLSFHCIVLYIYILYNHIYTIIQYYTWVSPIGVKTSMAFPLESHQTGTWNMLTQTPGNAQLLIRLRVTHGTTVAMAIGADSVLCFYCSFFWVRKHWPSWIIPNGHVPDHPKKDFFRLSPGSGHPTFPRVGCRWGESHSKHPQRSWARQSNQVGRCWWRGQTVFWSLKGWKHVQLNKIKFFDPWLLHQFGLKLFDPQHHAFFCGTICELTKSSPRHVMKTFIKKKVNKR